MEKTTGRDDLLSLKSSANSPSFEATQVAVNPAALQLKTNGKFANKEDVSETEIAESPFQFSAADIPPAPPKSSNNAFQLKPSLENSDGEAKEGSLDDQAYQLAAEGEGRPSDSSESDAGNDDSSSNNTGLPYQLKSGIENLSGYSLDDVQVHRNSDKPAQLQAHAFAQGTDIHLGPGQEKHLPHEAWHVVQQKQGRVQATKQLKAFNINDDAGLEKEADVMGAKAMQLSYKPESEGLISRSAFQLNSPIQREKFDVDTDYGTDLMDKNHFHVYCDLTVFLRKDGNSLSDMEYIAELISMLFPFPIDKFPLIIEHSEAEMIAKFKREIERRFESNRWRKYYLLSYLNSNNGSEIGEPSFLARALLATGLISNLNVNSDLDYVISIFESASQSELVEFKNAGILEYLISNLKVRSNYISKATHITKAKIDYLEKHIQNKTTDYTPEAGAKRRESKKDKDAEGLLLIKTITSKLGPWNKGKLLKKNSAIERIRAWANDLEADERAFIQSSASTTYAFLKDENNIDQNYSAYILSLFSSVEEGDDHDAAEVADADADIIIAYLNSKRKVKSGSKKFNTMLEIVDGMSHAARIRTLEKITRLTDLRTDHTKRKEALDKFSQKLDRLTNIKGSSKTLLLNAFAWGAESGSAVKNGPLHEIQKIVSNRSILAEDFGKSILPHVRQLNPSEILQILKSDLWSAIAYRGHGLGNTSEFQSVKILLGMGMEGSARLDMFAKHPEGEGAEKQYVIDQVELRPEYWAEKIKLSIGDRRFMNKGKLRRNKNDVLSIIAQSYYAGQRAVEKDPRKYEEVKSFTEKIITELSDLHQGFLRENLSSGFNALRDGTPVSASDRLDMAELGSKFKHMKGYKMKASAVIRSITDAKGLELLNEWSDFPSFIDRIKLLTPAARKAEVVAYIPGVNSTLLDRIKEALPANEFSQIHRDLLFKMSSALKEDARFKEMLDSISVENLSIRGEMLKSLGLLNREQIVDTGWQMNYFSTRGPLRKEAKRIVLHRLRKANTGVIEASPDLPDLESALEEANENLEERTEVFDAVKAKAIKGILFTISIILGVLTTVGSLGIAGPLIAAGLPTLLVSFMVSTVFTGIASSIKAVVESQLTGGAYNTAEGAFNVVKDILMAATTVAAGQVGEQVMAGWKMTPGIQAIFQAAEADGASVGSKILYSFVEKFLAVSPVEVAMRNITEGLITNFSSSESDDREGLGWAEVGGFLRDFTVDALLKTTMDIVGTDMLGVVNADSAVIAPATSPDADDAIESIGPLLYRIEPEQVLYIIAAENFITSQNYSVAEQDSIIGNLLVDRATDWATEKITTIGSPSSEHETAKTAGGTKMTLKEKMRHLPVGLIVDKFINTPDLVNIILSKNPGLNNPNDLEGFGLSEAKLVEVIKEFQAREISNEKIRRFFGSDKISTKVRKQVGMRHKKKKRSKKLASPSASPGIPKHVIVEVEDDEEEGPALKAGAVDPDATINPIFDGIVDEEEDSLDLELPDVPMNEPRAKKQAEKKKTLVANE